MNVKKSVIGLAAAGAIVTILGGVLGWVVLPGVVNDTVKKDTAIKPGTPVYNIWEKAPVPITMKYWFFDIQNPEEVMQGKKPLLIERGPYVYKESREKYDVHQGEFMDLIKYREVKVFQYDDVESKSSGLLESDEITTVNILYLTVGKVVRDLLGNLPASVLNGVFSFLDERLTEQGEGLLMTRSVGEMLYKGWDISKYLKIIRELCDKSFVDVICNNIGIDEILDQLDQHPYFGLFSTKNNTDEGEFVIGTGHSNPRYTGEIWTWKGEEFLDYWDQPWEQGNYCNMLNGTDGTIFRPFLDQKERIYIYQTDLCRSIFLEYAEDVEYKGISVSRYVLSPDVGESAAVYPDNICFCEDVKNVSTCLRAPAFSMEKCLFGAPVVGSTAHFFDGDGYYLSVVDGVSPPDQSHQTFADIEPLTGAPFYIAKRVQINMDLKKYDGLSGFQNISERTIFPMLWFEESAGLTDEYIEAFRWMVIVPTQAIEGIRWTLIALGAILILASLVVFIKKRNT